ncbi:SigE family RNA polymerase sigma factor [Streptoalloteichus hindustanus]|uniref:RNA polymerase sigma-70 factor, sigma-E family n=1 Tax=Streptoalloteichus hindustanus TaxID=2017 RepID=A0A1M4VCX2_STRHI|nr:SigE family RNA polymerase sigma factor [Streptoalloteichus hindustanus]SHE66775.1 RNA polymerase sigma-70 factor, sigma-E family [Streptoalloteichus hindustanus]
MDEDFAAFAEAALPGLLRYGYALAGNPHDAADLVQTALERVGSRWSRVVARSGDPHAYVRRTMANLHVSFWRRRRRENVVAVVPDEAVAGEFDRVEHEPLWRALAGLPAKQRAVLVLRYYEDLSEAEIADVLGVSRGTVKSHASRAMSTLRAHLDSLAGKGAQ